MIGFFSAVMLVINTSAQTSPFNDRAVVPADSSGHFRLLFGGHFHGSSFGRSGYPAATLLANLDTINALNATALLSTGDLFLSADKDSARYVDSFFKKLNTPLFNAPGNHDVEGKVYLRSYGPTYTSFDIGPDRVILLDTELNNGNLEGEQFAMLQDRLESFTGQNIFIVSHRPIWSENNERYAPLFAGNTRSAFSNNYMKDVYPLVKKVAGRAQVFWISGSMAGRAPASIFFQEHEQGITFIQSAIRDELRDAVLIADVSKLPSSSGEGEGVRPPSVKWTGLSLTGQPLEPVQSYDAAWWKAHQGTAEPFAWRRIPYLIKKTVTNLNYWYGFGTAVLLLLLGWRIRR
ncbi:MAG TPA: metallophosphoesterase [Flavobacteriales bacterium]|nr:metallophosphoesterase [Flavobacteriales bacterium]